MQFKDSKNRGERKTFLVKGSERAKAPKQEEKGVIRELQIHQCPENTV